jgi:glycosyltransferase involved in cell wall biosynthesis
MDVLVTHYEQNKTVRDSIESLNSQLSTDHKIYVIDAGSQDGSFTKLEKLTNNNKIHSLQAYAGVSRGRARQIAFERSSDDIVIAHTDLDTIFQPVLEQIENVYRNIRSDHGSGILLVHGCFISDRKTINSVGGWNDLQTHEDKDLWVRADADTNLYELPISAVQHHDNFEWNSRRYQLKRLYQNYRDAIRLGIPRSALAKSDRHQQSLVSWPVRKFLLNIAARHAKSLTSYSTFKNNYPDPTEFHLRELTFRTLVAGDIIHPEALPVPAELSQYKTDRNYPGKTSYS